MCATIVPGAWLLDDEVSRVVLADRVTHAWRHPAVRLIGDLELLCRLRPLQQLNELPERLTRSSIATPPTANGSWLAWSRSCAAIVKV